MDTNDLAFLTGDTVGNDHAMQASSSTGGTTAVGSNVLRVASAIVIASLVALWLLGMTFR